MASSFVRITQVGRPAALKAGLDKKTLSELLEFPFESHLPELGRAKASVDTDNLIN